MCFVLLPSWVNHIHMRHLSASGQLDLLPNKCKGKTKRKLIFYTAYIIGYAANSKPCSAGCCLEKE